MPLPLSAGSCDHWESLLSASLSVVPVHVYRRDDECLGLAEPEGCPTPLLVVTLSEQLLGLS